MTIPRRTVYMRASGPCIRVELAAASSCPVRGDGRGRSGSTRVRVGIPYRTEVEAVHDARLARGDRALLACGLAQRSPSTAR
jgi:hypothetical protein